MAFNHRITGGGHPLNINATDEWAAIRRQALARGHLFARKVTPNPEIERALEATASGHATAGDVHGEEDEMIATLPDLSTRGVVGAAGLSTRGAAGTSTVAATYGTVA